MALQARGSRLQRRRLSGPRAVQQLKQVVGAVRMFPLFDAVSIPFHTQFLDEDGSVRANDVMEQAVATMLDELVHVEWALRPLRQTAPVA